MKQTVDAIAGGAAASSYFLTILGYVPEILAAVASACAIAWYVIRYRAYRKSGKID